VAFSHYFYILLATGRTPVWRSWNP